MFLFFGLDVQHVRREQGDFLRTQLFQRARMGPRRCQVTPQPPDQERSAPDVQNRVLSSVVVHHGTGSSATSPVPQHSRGRSGGSCFHDVLDDLPPVQKTQGQKVVDKNSSQKKREGEKTPRTTPFSTMVQPGPNRAMGCKGKDRNKGRARQKPSIEEEEEEDAIPHT